MKNNTAQEFLSETELYSGPCTVEITSNGKRQIAYLGNKSSGSLADVHSQTFERAMEGNRVKSIISDPSFKHLHEVDNQVFYSTVEYFKERKAQWCNLPLTTLMISSPGEVYAGKTLDYTTDTLPIDIKWFDDPKRVFLAESSQFYLELRLLLENVDEVFCIYNSFRKEKADFSHLAEFQHIEFEGHVGFQQNIEIAQNLVAKIVNDVVQKSPESISHFLEDHEIQLMLDSVRPASFEQITLKEALKILYRDTKDSRYEEFTLRHFGAWEEIRLTQILGRNIWVTHFPMMQIPFYHNQHSEDENGVPLAENADLIMLGYREVVGSGVRIQSPTLLAQKALAFNLPPEDYAPYLQTRDSKQYQSSAGFGLGWQRLTHWMLKLPAIWEASHVPRGHLRPTP